MPLRTVTGLLTPVAPFDFDQTLRFAARFNPRAAEPGVGPKSLTRAVRAATQPVAFRVESTGTTGAPELAYTLYADQTITPAVQDAAADRIAFYLSLHDDLEPFYALAQEDPPFLPVLDQLYGYHQVKFLTPFENACWAILSQRNQWTNAQRMASALVERYGTRLTVEGTDYWAYPEPVAQIGRA